MAIEKSSSLKKSAPTTENANKLLSHAQIIITQAKQIETKKARNIIANSLEMIFNKLCNDVEADTSEMIKLIEQIKLSKLLKYIQSKLLSKNINFTSQLHPKLFQQFYACHYFCFRRTLHKEYTKIVSKLDDIKNSKGDLSISMQKIEIALNQINRKLEKNFTVSLYKLNFAEPPLEFRQKHRYEIPYNKISQSTLALSNILKNKSLDSRVILPVELVSTHRLLARMDLYQLIYPSAPDNNFTDYMIKAYKHYQSIFRYASFIINTGIEKSMEFLGDELVEWSNELFSDLKKAIATTHATSKSYPLGNSLNYGLSSSINLEKAPSIETIYNSLKQEIKVFRNSIKNFQAASWLQEWLANFEKNLAINPFAKNLKNQGKAKKKAACSKL